MTKIAAYDAAIGVEDKLNNPKVTLRDVTLVGSKVRTWAHGTVPATLRGNIVGTYDARATAEMISEDLEAAGL